MDEDSKSCSVTYLLYRSIENMKEIKDLLTNNCLKAAVVNPALIYHQDQLLLASHRSIYNEKNQQMKTKSIFTELLYNLYPSRSIRDALKSFGAQENGKCAAFVIFGDKSKKIAKDIENSVKGQPVSLEQLCEFRDLKAIRKLYKIPDILEDEHDILNCILTKIASKEILL